MKIFTLDIDGRPTLVFDASSIDEAEGICALPEFRADLAELTSHGAPLFGEIARFAARDASAVEIASYCQAAERSAPSDAAAEGPVMAFLVPIDGMLVTMVQPD